MTAEAHVVFGTGPAGRAVATALLDQGARVRMVNRSGIPGLTSVETIGGDATDPEFAREVAADADTVYFCLNAPNYHRWADEFPPLQRAVLDAAKAADAKLVVLENLYLYGPSPGLLRETTPVNPTSAKSRTRAAMSAEVLDAHQRGEIRVVVGRASDFVGPGVRNARELLHTYYQFAAPFVVDDSAFRHAFGGHTTHWGDIVASTVDWYRAQSPTPEFSTGLAASSTSEVAA